MCDWVSCSSTQAKRKNAITPPLPICNRELSSECENDFAAATKIDKYFSKEIVHFGNKLLILTASIFLAVVFAGKHFKFRNISFKYLGKTHVWNFKDRTSLITGKMLPNRNKCKNARAVTVLEPPDKNACMVTRRSCTSFPKHFRHFCSENFTRNMQPFDCSSATLVELCKLNRIPLVPQSLFPQESLGLKFPWNLENPRKKIMTSRNRHLTLKYIQEDIGGQFSFLWLRILGSWWEKKILSKMKGKRANSSGDIEGGSWN